MIESEVQVGADLRITCSKDELVHGLSLVARALSTRTAIQILSGILLEASGSELRLAATDMELSVRATVPAQVQGEGSIVLPGRTIVDIARLLPADEVTLEHRASESVVHLSSGSASYTLQTFNAEDFPRLPDPAEATTFTVECAPLLETIGRVARAASRDEARPVLTGVLVQFTGGKLVMAATDSYRLAIKETPLSGAPAELEAIIPSRALNELAYSYESLVSLEPAIMQFESNPQFAQVAAPSDMVVVSTYETRIGAEVGELSLCVPFSSLQPVLDRAVTHSLFADRSAGDPDVIRGAIGTRVEQVPVEVSVRFSSVRLTSAEIVGLREGDVLPLHHAVADPLTVTAVGQPLLCATPGKRGKRLAVMIVDPVRTNA